MINSLKELYVNKLTLYFNHFNKYDAVPEEYQNKLMQHCAILKESMFNMAIIEDNIRKNKGTQFDFPEAGLAEMIYSQFNETELAEEMITLSQIIDENLEQLKAIIRC